MSTLTTYIVKKDIACFYALNQKIQCHLLSSAMKKVTHFGSLWFALIVTLIVSILELKSGIFLAGNLIVSQIFIQTLKRLINRPRPYKTLQWAIAQNPPKCEYSLPSGHSAAALTIALSFVWWIPSFQAVFVAGAIMVGFSRVYLGCHYPLDVVAGFAISYGSYELVKIILPALFPYFLFM